MKYFIPLLLLFPNTPKAQTEKGIGHGTSIATFFTSDSIVIAADSKLTVEFRDTSWSKQVKKIVSYNNIFFSCAGLGFSFDKKGNTLFNAFTLMTSILKKGYSFDKSIVLFDSIAVRIIDSMYQLNLLLFKGKGIFEGQLVSFVNGKPYFRFWTYMINQKTNHIIPVDENTLEKIPFLHPLGNKDNLLKVAKERLIKSKDYVQTLKGLIKVEVESNKREVGEPINVVVIYPRKKAKHYF